MKSNYVQNIKEKKDLNFYRLNAEEDYMKTPISVLRYITELENALGTTECNHDYIPSCGMGGTVFDLCTKCGHRVFDKQPDLTKYNDKIKIHPSHDAPHFFGIYSDDNKMWLEKNVGGVFNAFRKGLNYYQLENGFICHLYDCINVTILENK